MLRELCGKSRSVMGHFRTLVFYGEASPDISFFEHYGGVLRDAGMRRDLT